MLTNRPFSVLVVEAVHCLTARIESLAARESAARLQIFGVSGLQPARNWIDDHCCDLLIVDSHLHPAQSSELLQYAKHRNAWTQVVLIVEAASWRDAAAAMEQGASEYLIHPLDARTLYNVVSHYRSRARRWHRSMAASSRAAAEHDRRPPEISARHAAS